MTTATLLAELEAATYDHRVRRMVALGRQARTDAAAAAVLHPLATAAGFYERQLALLACFGSADGAQVLAALAGPSRLLRHLALSMVAKICPDEQVRVALATLPRKAQLVLLRTLWQRGRHEAIDAWLAELAESADERLALFLFLGSPATVEKYLAAVLPRWGTVDWVRLAKYHPTVAFAQLRAQQQAQTAPDARLLTHLNAVLPALAERQPDYALALVRQQQLHHLVGAALGHGAPVEAGRGLVAQLLAHQGQ
ncbi:MAG: hypothetical protein EOO59_15860, partial [Hymenobacter sp.]